MHYPFVRENRPRPLQVLLHDSQRNPSEKGKKTRIKVQTCFRVTGGGVSGAGCNVLVQRSSAVLCSTQARDLVLLQRELVVVGDFFIDGDGLLRVDHDLLLGLYCDHLGVTVWLEEQTKGTQVSGGSRGRG